MGKIEFTYNGKAMTARENSTVAEALGSNGVKVGNYSVRLRRWREEYHPFKDIPSAWVTVDGIPNVNAYRTGIQNGMEIMPQTGKSILNSITRRWGPGFYYKKFKKPEFLRKLFFREVEKHNDYGGSVDPGKAINNRIAELRFSHSGTLEADVLIIGAGRAGIAAALSLAAGGRNVVILDRTDMGSIEKVYTHVVAEAGRSPELVLPGTPGYGTFASMAESKGIKLLVNTTVFGCYEGVFAAISGESGVVLVKPRLVAACTGSEEIKPRFCNNDLPGIMTASSFLALSDFSGGACASDGVTLYIESWISPHMIEELSSRTRVRNIVIGYECDELSKKNITEAFSTDAVSVLTGFIQSADGKRRVESITVYCPEKRESVHITTCLLLLAGRRQPRMEIPYLMGMNLRFSDEFKMAVPAVDEMFSSGSLFACGSLVGMTERASIASGLICGASLSAKLGLKSPDSRNLQSWLSFVRDLRPVRPYGSAMEDMECVLCPCVDVTAGDIADAIADGYETLNMIKRYTGLFTGPCQGARCLRNSIEAYTSLSGMETDLPTVRSPIIPVYLGALALTEVKDVVDRE